MPNISTSNTNSIYEYSASITLPFDESNPYIIDALHIKGIIIDTSYDTHIFPLIYVTVAISNKIEDMLVQHQSTGTVIFNLQKRIMNGDFPGLLVDYINGKFIYFMPNSASGTDEQSEIENPEEVDDITKIYTIGLISLDHINKSKKKINGVINKGSKSSIIYYLLKDHNLLMEPLTNNPIMNSVILPPSGSITNTIRYLNDLEVLYDTPYRFFMDYDTTYLTSSSGKLVSRKGSTYDNIIINIRKEFDEANMEGMITDKDLGAYVINASGTFCSIVDSSLNDKGYDKLFTATTSGNNSEATISNIEGSEIKSKMSTIRLPNENSGLLKNIEYSKKLNSIALSISTTRIDSSIITMDKIYTINADDIYGSDFSGQYLLSKKKEIYIPEGEGLALNIAMLFKKIPG